MNTGKVRRVEQRNLLQNIKDTIRYDLGRKQGIRNDIKQNFVERLCGTTH